MIRAKLAFDAIGCLCKRACHYCSVVDQNVDCLDAFIDFRGALPDSLLAAEV